MRPDRAYNYCPRCGKPVAEDASPFPCASCNYVLPAGEDAVAYKCYHCKGRAPRGSAYCPSCGQPFTILVLASSSRSDSDSSNAFIAIPPPPDSFASTSVLDESSVAGTEVHVADRPAAPTDIVSGFQDRTFPKEPFAWKEVDTEQVFETIPFNRQLPPPPVHTGAPGKGS